MPKPKLADVLEANSRLSRENTVQMLALMFLGGDVKADGSERGRDDEGGHYTWRLFGAARKDGGILVTIVKRPDSKPDVSAAYLDDAYGDAELMAMHHPSTFTCTRRDAIYKLRALRNSIAVGTP